MLYDRLATAIKLVCFGGFPGISLRQPKKQTDYQHQKQCKKDDYDQFARERLIECDFCFPSHTILKFLMWLSATLVSREGSMAISNLPSHLTFYEQNAWFRLWRLSARECASCMSRWP
jgi:hypothetical protein